MSRLLSEFPSWDRFKGIPRLDAVPEEAQNKAYKQNPNTPCKDIREQKNNVRRTNQSNWSNLSGSSERVKEMLRHLAHPQAIYIHLNLNPFYIHEGCSKFLHVENVIFSKKNYFRQTLANPMFIFSGTCWPRLVRRTWMRDILKFVPGVWSLVTLHSLAAALKHLRSALRCWSLLTFIGQFWHNKSTV